jgi:hypothetical protein
MSMPSGKVSPSLTIYSDGRLEFPRILGKGLTNSLQSQVSPYVYLLTRHRGAMFRSHLMGVGGDWAKEADQGFALAGHDILSCGRCRRIGWDY